MAESTNSNINVRNVYIELLNKMKAIEGVDIEYIDKLVQLLYDDINLIDIDVKNIKDLIPEDATTTNQLATMSDLPAAQVNADWDATSGVAEILNKPTIPAAQVNADWNATSGVAAILNKPTIPATEYQAKATIAANSWTLESGSYIYDYTLPSGYDDNFIPVIALTGIDGNPPGTWNEADFNKIFWVRSWTGSGLTKVRFYASAQPTNELRIIIKGQ